MSHLEQPGPQFLVEEDVEAEQLVAAVVGDDVLSGQREDVVLPRDQRLQHHVDDASPESVRVGAALPHVRPERLQSPENGGGMGRVVTRELYAVETEAIWCEDVVVNRV